jgi:hypothetical protein
MKRQARQNAMLRTVRPAADKAGQKREGTRRRVAQVVGHPRPGLLEGGPFAGRAIHLRDETHGGFPQPHRPSPELGMRAVAPKLAGKLVQEAVEVVRPVVLHGGLPQRSQARRRLVVAPVKRTWGETRAPMWVRGVGTPISVVRRKVRTSEGRFLPYLRV